MTGNTHSTEHVVGLAVSELDISQPEKPDKDKRPEPPNFAEAMELLRELDFSWQGSGEGGLHPIGFWRSR